MKIEYDVTGDSFRALSAKKLGLSVLELCIEERADSTKETEAAEAEWMAEHEGAKVHTC